MGGLRPAVGYATLKVAGGEADGSKIELEGGVVPRVDRRARVVSEVLELLRDLERAQKKVSARPDAVQTQMSEASQRRACSPWLRPDGVRRVRSGWREAKRVVAWRAAREARGGARAGSVGTRGRARRRRQPGAWRGGRQRGWCRG
jgi:hypothetical protein